MKCGVIALLARLGVIRYISYPSLLGRLRHASPRGCVTQEYAAAPDGSFSNFFGPGTDRVLRANIAGRFG
jgi:hypothetical protein